MNFCAQVRMKRKRLVTDAFAAQVLGKEEIDDNETDLNTPLKVSLSDKKNDEDTI